MEPIPASVMNAGLSKRGRYNTHRRNCGNEGKFGFIGHYPSPLRSSPKARIAVVATFAKEI
jgi:hypothetical protein